MNRLAISSLCFLNLKKNFYTLIKKTKINNIELAPTMVCKKLDIKKFKNFKKKLEKDKKKVVALQSIFFNTKINIENKDFNEKFQYHMKKIKLICNIFKCNTINLGASNLRVYKIKKNKKKLEDKLVYSIKKFLNKNGNLTINLEPIYSSRKNYYVYQSYKDCLTATKSNRMKNFKVLYDLSLANFYNFKIRSFDIKNSLFGHVHLNDLGFLDIKTLFLKKIINKFSINSYEKYYSFEYYFDRKSFNSFIKIYG